MTNIYTEFKSSWDRFAATANWEAPTHQQLLTGLELMRSAGSNRTLMPSTLMNEMQSATVLGRKLTALEAWAHAEFSIDDVSKYLAGEIDG